MTIVLRRVLPLLGRIGAFCLLSGVVLGLTTDQFLAKVTADASFLPGPFRFKTLPGLSIQELGSRTEIEAMDTARLAVLRQPLSVEALGALAQSSATLKLQMSTKALSQAAALGWRGVSVQTAVIGSAAAAKRWDVAAPRLLALAKLHTLDALDHSVFVTAHAREYAPQIVQTFAHDGVAWFRFSSWLRARGGEKQSMYLLAQTPFYSDEDACNQLGFLARKFVHDGQIDFAADLIGVRCQSYLTPPTNGLSINQHFGQVRRGPFEWQMIPHSGVSFRAGLAQGKAVVEITNADPLPRKIAIKLVQRGDYNKPKKVLYEDLDSIIRKPRILKISYECAMYSVKGSKSLTNLTRTSGVDCDVFRAFFQLSTGHFRLWTD